MLEAYSLNVTAPAETAIPLNNVTLKKGCTAELSSASTIQLNKCGVYMVSCDASSASTGAAIQLYKDGIAQPQAQGTGGTPAFITLVQVTENNSCCPCASPTTLQIFNPTDASVTYTDINVVVSKLI